MRLEKLEKKLNKIGLDSFIFLNRNNIYYFSGYSGEGMLFYESGKVSILTDFRYVEQAHQESPGTEVIDIGNKSYAQVLSLFVKRGKKVGFEQDDASVSFYAAVTKEFKGVELVPTTGIGADIRAVKDESEIELIKVAMNATQEALYKAYDWSKVGMSEIELCAELEYFLKKNYGAGTAFDFIVASGENGSMPHAVTGNKKFEQGDMITLDFGAYINKYNADMTRTYSLGEPDKKLSDIYKIVKEAQTKAQSALAPGASCRDIDKIARDIITDYGYGKYFGHGTGHGVGLNIHEEPRLNTKSETVLQEGMVVTVEPGIYIPGLGGVRIENTCYITKDGYKSFFDASTDLNIIDGGKL